LALGSKGLALDEICPPANIASFPPPSYYGLAYMFSSSSSSCAPSAIRGPFGLAGSGWAAGSGLAAAVFFFNTFFLITMLSSSESTTSIYSYS